MPKIIYRTTLTIATLTILTVALYNATSIDIILTFAITLGTTSYHFIMRLLVGLIFNLTMRNRADYTKSWYQVSNFENRIYKELNVKKWKNRMPTYDASLFDVKVHSLQEIVQAMCQAELVHDKGPCQRFYCKKRSTGGHSKRRKTNTNERASCFCGTARNGNVL